MASMIASHTCAGVQGTASLTRCGCECENARKRSMYQSSYSGAMDLSDYDIGEEVGSDECLHLVGEKKKRLKFSQVKRLEKSFEVANRLDPETKIRLAKELGLRPRQIAVWFQNRRARRKTKQVEKDFDALKKEYDALKSKYHILLEENKKLKDKGNCSYLSTNRLDVIGDPNDLVCIEAEAPQNSFNFEIEPKQNSATSVLQPTDFPMELSVTSKICQKCAVPVRDIYPTATKEQEGGGYCSITSEAASSVFNIESTPSPRFPHNIAAAAANFSPISVVEGSSIGEQIAAGLETPPAGDELHCLQETLPELDVDQIASINQAEETCRRLFYGLDEEGPLMLWDY